MKNSIFIFTAIVLFVFSAKSQSLPKVEIITDFGNIVVEPDTINAPVTAKNFLSHVYKKTYKKASFYRVVRFVNQPKNNVKIEVIQGGLLDEAEIEKIPTIEHETTNNTGIKHFDGTISMARAEPGTASTEFFICIGTQPELDFGGKRNPDGQGFAAFGKVIKGMDVVRKIQQQKDTEQMLDMPIKIIEMKIAE